MMKRLIAWSLGLILIMTSIAFAERTGWTCPQCGTVCSPVQNYCQTEGQPAPWVWTCSECGTERNTEDRCRKCGKTQDKKTQDEKQHNRLPVVGDIMTFGHYHQTAAGNDSTPIEWYVLDVQGNKALLLSRYALEYKENEKGRSYYQSWNLRTWMNEDFFTYAFTDAEQAGVITTKVDNSAEQTDKAIYFGPNTEDRVFLLSYHELSKYITNSRVLACSMTKYAEQQMDRAGEEWYWFLRSPSSTNLQGVNRNYCINANGTVGNYNCAKRVMGGVRPALWLDLSAEGWMVGAEKVEIGEKILWNPMPSPIPGSDVTAEPIVYKPITQSPITPVPVTPQPVTPTPHSHGANYKIIDYTAPTCAGRGYIMYECECGEYRWFDTIPATGQHIWTHYLLFKTCDKCGAIEWF